GYWKDVGDLLEYRLAHSEILDQLVKIPLPGQKRKTKEAVAYIGAKSDVSPKAILDGINVIGERCVIEERAKLTNCVLGNGVKIQSGADLTGCVLWDDVAIGPDTTIQEAVIGARTQVADKAHIGAGAIIGDDCQIGHASVVHSN